MLNTGFAPHSKDHFQIQFDCKGCKTVKLDEDIGKADQTLLNHKCLTGKKPVNSEQGVWNNNRINYGESTVVENQKYKVLTYSEHIHIVL